MVAAVGWRNRYPLTPPQTFDFKKPDEWVKWKRRFTQFLSVSGLSKEDEARQVSTLLYCLGDDAEGVLASTNITEDARKKYKDVVAKFDEYFDVRKNIIYERAKFNTRDQREGETTDEYITVLYELIETCEYGALKEDILRDRIVVGIRDKSMSEKLQLQNDLTLEKVKTATRQKDAVRQQSQQLATSAKEHLVEDVSRQTARRPTRGKVGGAAPKPQGGASASRCTRCGRRKHQGNEKCPARNVVCHNCKKRGHFKAHCLSKPSQASTAELEAEEEGAAFLGTLSSGSSPCWRSTVSLNNKRVEFKLDTGAEVTAVSEATYKQVYGKRLEHPTRVLYGPAYQSLKVLGQFRGQLTVKDKSHQETIFVVRGLKNNLLGLPALTALKLVQRVESTYSSLADVKKEFPTVFSGLGNFGEPYTIKLKDDAKPRALHTPRNVPIPLREKVSDELKRMESLGVISKVSEPTPAWLSCQRSPGMSAYA